MTMHQNVIWCQIQGALLHVLLWAVSQSNKSQKICSLPHSAIHPYFRLIWGKLFIHSQHISVSRTRHRTHRRRPNLQSIHLDRARGWGRLKTHQHFLTFLVYLWGSWKKGLKNRCDRQIRQGPMCSTAKRQTTADGPAHGTPINELYFVRIQDYTKKN